MTDSWKELYKPETKKNWEGRIDSLDDVDAFRWHQCITMVDLRSCERVENGENKNLFCFIGFVCDEGVLRNSGRPGASKGPQYLRKEMANLAWDEEKNIALFDAGNVFCKNKDLETAQAELSKAISKILDLGLTPILLGGGHDIAFGHFNGIINYLEKCKPGKNVGIINLDAHFDLRPLNENKGSSGTMFRQIANFCLKKEKAFNYYCLGIQTYANTKSLFKTANELNVKYELAKEIKNENLAILKQRISDFINKNDEIYLTICSDVFSSAHAPGVSAPQPFGLHPEIGLELIKHVVASGKLISFDIAEIAPRFDEDNRTAKLGAVIIYAIVNTISELNTGISFPYTKSNSL